MTSRHASDRCEGVLRRARTFNAPVACDLTNADDTLAERLAEYRRLFDDALLDRESTDTTTTFRFAARPGVRDWVLALVRREAACCPFLSFDVDQDDEQIVWTTSGGLGASQMAILDEFLAGPDHADDSSDHRPATGGSRRHLGQGAGR